MLKKTVTSIKAIVASSFFVASAVHAACPADLATLAPGTWCEVPDSQMRSEAFNWPAGVEFTQNGIGVRGVMDLWSGGAYDTKRNRLVVWGGGHSGYAGNELYAFDINTLKWARVTDPSIPVAYNSAYAPDGRPGSRHTYDQLEYVPSLDRFCSFVGGADYPSGSDRGRGQINCFDYDANQWERKATLPNGDTIDDVIGTKAAYDPVTSRVFVQSGPKGPFGSYSPADNNWTIDVASTSFIAYHSTTALDHKRRKMVFVGEGNQWVVDLNNLKADPAKFSTSGSAVIVNAKGPGLEYDPASDRIVGWAGGASVYTLNLDTLTWTQLPPAATNTVTPTGANSTGTYGRFRYIPSKNIYIVVNSIDENVYFYKLSNGGGIAAPATPAKPSVVIQLK